LSARRVCKVVQVTEAAAAGCGERAQHCDACLVQVGRASAAGVVLQRGPASTGVSSWRFAPRGECSADWQAEGVGTGGGGEGKGDHPAIACTTHTAGVWPGRAAARCRVHPWPTLERARGCALARPPVEVHKITGRGKCPPRAPAL